MAAKGIEQRHRFRLYQSVVLGVTDWPRPQNNAADKSAKAGQSDERGNDS